MVEYIITKKKAGVLYLVKRNFKKASRAVKEILYLENIRSVLEYAGIIWTRIPLYLVE